MDWIVPFCCLLYILGVLDMVYLNENVELLSHLRAFTCYSDVLPINSTLVHKSVVQLV